MLREDLQRPETLYDTASVLTQRCLPAELGLILLRAWMGVNQETKVQEAWGRKFRGSAIEAPHHTSYL